MLGMAILLQGIGQNGETSFSTLSISDGLSGSLVKSLFQDSKGFLWVGVENGLNRYDGYDFVSHTFQNEPDTVSLLPGIVLAICESDSGYLWIGTDNGLCRFDPKYQVFSHHPLPIPSTVRSLLFDRQKTLWIGTEEGLFYQKRGGEIQAFTLFSDDLPPNILHIFQDTTDHIWIGSEDQGLLRLDLEGKLSHFNTTNSSLPSNKINRIFEDQKGEIWAATGRGVARFESASASFTRLDLPHATNALLQRSEVESIVEDKNGNMWFGTFDNGLFHYNWRENHIDRLGSNPNQPGSLSDSVILSLLIDRSGLLWVGTLRGGVNAHNPLQVNFGKISQLPDKHRSLLSNEVYAIFEDQEGNVWFGTDAGISIMGHANGFHTHILSTGRSHSLSGESVYSMLQDREGNVWVGTGGEGLNMVKAKDLANKEYRFTYFRYDNGHSGGLISDDISCLFQDKKDHIWVGTLEGLTKLEATGNWVKNYHAKNTSLSNPEIQCVYEDHEGVVWVGTFQGLNRYHAESDDFKPFGLMSKETVPLVKGTIYAIHEDASHNLWVGTDRGLCRLNERRDRGHLYTGGGWPAR